MVCSETHIPPSISLPAARTDAEVDAAPRPLLTRQDSPHHPLLATRLHVPRPRTQLVSRVRLVERLQQGVERALTLVSAPAGFGKTTLLAQWCAQSVMPVAWLSSEVEDNDPRANAICERFLRSVRQECLDHLLILEEKQLQCVLNAYVAYFDQARPHQGIGQQIPGSSGSPRATAHKGSRVV